MPVSYTHLLYHHLAVTVPVFAVGGKGILQGGLGGFRQVVGGHHGHVIVCMDGKEILPDEVVAEEMCIRARAYFAGGRKTP